MSSRGTFRCQSSISVRVFGYDGLFHVAVQASVSRSVQPASILTVSAPNTRLSIFKRVTVSRSSAFLKLILNDF